MSDSAWLVLCLVAPFVGAVVIAFTGWNPNLREGVTLGTAGVLLLGVMSLWPSVDAGVAVQLVIAEPFPGLALAFDIEPLGYVFAVVASVLWIATSVYSIGYMRGHDEPNQTRFYTCFAVAIGSVMGIAFAGNLFTLFTFYEVLTLSTYPLVTHSGTDEAKRAGRVYLGILLSTSIGMLLLAIVWTLSLAGTLDFRPGGILDGTAPAAVLNVLFLLYVFGIGKAALMPFHRWLPAAMVAPTPVSALLHAVAVVKAGVFTVLKVSVYVFGPDLLNRLGASQFIAYLAAFTIIATSVIAFGKDNLKARLAYSTIGQLSYVVLGAAVANIYGIVGAGMHIVMHAFGKITLFFCAGAIMVAAHRTLVSELDGIGRRMPVTMLAFTIASLGIIGLPPLGGLWSKWMLAYGTVDAGHPLLLVALLLSTLLNVGYLLPIGIRAFFRAPADGRVGEGVSEAPLPCVAALVFSCVASVFLFFYPEPLYRLLMRVATASGVGG